MSKCRSLIRGINPLLMMNRAGHRVFQQVAPGVCMHAAAGGDQRCFFVVQAEIGNPDPEQTVVCFNVPPDEITCGVSSPTDGFWFQKNAQNITTQSYIDAPTNTCLRFQTQMIQEGNGISPDDTVTMYYTQGTCHKAGDNDPECVLENVVAAIVKNSIYRVTAARVGDPAIGDDTVLVVFETPLQTVGNNWTVDVNSINRNIIGSSIVNGNLRLQLDSPVISTDTVEVNHNDVLNGAVAEDGRKLWQFTLYPVLNVVGQGFWNRQDEGPWILDQQTGRWRLEN